MTRPHRPFDADELVLATHNPGKLKEIAALMAPFGVTTLGAGALDLPEPEETGTSYTANAELKARAAALGSGKPALADDSGLSVAALGGAPGIHSARWAGPAKDFALAMHKVAQDLHKAGAEDWSAEFVCALSLAWPDGHCESVEGRVAGTLVWPPRGDRGFGYDAMFQPDGYAALTFGEMDPAKKHAMSHRAVAFAKLVDACFRRTG